jgi:Tfp pilus assembly protein PilO
MVDERRQKLINVWMPAFCAAVALLIVFLQYRNLNQAKADVAETQHKIQALDENLKDRVNKLGIKAPAVLLTSKEDTMFLEDLKKAAQDTGIQIVRWTSTSRPAGADQGAAPPAILKGITAVNSELEVYGPYDSVRAFVRRLESWPRMLNMSGVSWHRGTKDGTRLFMTVIRYVREPSVGSASATGGTQ